MISGDRGGQGVGSSLPIYLFGNVALAGYAVEKKKKKYDIKFRN
jgi:hypothetical protein